MANSDVFGSALRLENQETKGLRNYSIPRPGLGLSILRGAVEPGTHKCTVPIRPSVTKRTLPMNE